MGSCGARRQGHARTRRHRDKTSSCRNFSFAPNQTLVTHKRDRKDDLHEWSYGILDMEHAGCQAEFCESLMGGDELTQKLLFTSQKDALDNPALKGTQKAARRAAAVQGPARPPLVPASKDRQHPTASKGIGGDGGGDGENNDISNEFEYLGTESRLDEALKQLT
ncbi:hypothetical protein E2C01_031086 [Portunus trituberculatus]|uniref:Uncharacterized protein n=1 Tax=Portunus trituberculatus TaxID=210409 RepID=A0A5B7ES50_PORTR|nr:hypothetical protein [Portunus trituberculatus]